MKSIKKKVLTIIATIMMMGFVTSVMAQVPDTRQENETFPQEQNQQNQQTLPENEQEHMRHQEHMRPQEEGVDPQEQHQMGEVEYDEEIEENELPATVTTSLETMYADYDVDKVYRGTDESYKVKVKNGDEEKVVYYDSEGTFVKEKDKEDDKHKDENKDW